jgi:type II secretory pathway component PulF
MATFHYQALNSEQELVTGELTADTVELAVAQLHATGLAVQLIRLLSPKTTTSEQISSQSVQNVDQTALHSHVASLLALGKTIAPALRAYTEEMSPGRRRRQLNAVVGVLERGDTAEATTALTALPDYWIPLLSAATMSHDPGRVLREFLDESQRADELRRQWWLALAYPVFVLVMATLVFVALSFIVIPIFAAVFSDWDIDLPAFTRVIIALASWVTHGQALIFALFCTAVGLILWAARGFLPESIRCFFRDRFSPPLGRRAALSKFARFTADLLEGGLGISEAIRIAGIATNKSHISTAARQLATEIGPRTSAARQLSEGPLTAAVLFAVRAEMNTLARIHLLREISNCYATRNRLRLLWMRSLIEPLSICVVGAVVGGIVIALYLPLVNLINGLCR